MAGGAWFHWHWADLGLKRTDFFDFAHIRWLDLICFIGKKKLLKSGGPWNPTQGVHAVHAGAIVQNSIHMSKTLIIHHHKSGTYIHTYIHT